MVTRQTILDTLRAALEPLDHVRAAFLAGSDAFGRADRWSDIDVSCVAPLSSAPEIFGAVETALTKISPILHQLEMPESGLWPELAQRFYRLAGTDEFLIIDLCVLTQAQLRTFLEPTRHGVPVVWIDRDGLVAPVPLDRAAHDAALMARLAALRSSFPMFQTLARKAVLRGDTVEAMAMWIAHTMRPLVELLRMRHCPERYDFGFRYTGYDLPAEVAGELADLMWPRDGDDLLTKLDRAAELFARTSSELPR